MISNQKSTNETESKCAFKFCNDENESPSSVKYMNYTFIEEYFESQSKAKLQENYDCFKYRQEQNIDKKALDKSKNKATISNSSQLIELKIKTKLQSQTA